MAADQTGDRLTGTTAPTQARPHHHRRPCRRRLYAGIVAAAAAVSLGGCASNSTQPIAADRPTASQPSDSSAEIPKIVERTQPSIVTILADNGSPAVASSAIGSGVIYRADGVIVTNRHVVANATRIQVGLADGSRLAGRIVAADPDTDLAVIRVDRGGLPAAQFSGTAPVVGGLAVALGSPLGFEKSVTAGIVSGLHRAIPGSASETRALVDLIQTDAAISPGNSGGAVVDARGQVLGISVAYVPPQQGAVSVGFAIPATTATRVVDELLTRGRASHAYLGLQPGELTPEIARQLRVTDGGVIVYGVTPNGPAAQAGVRPGDVLRSIGDRQVRSVEDLFVALREHRPGETVTFTYVRDRETHIQRVTISDRPS
jgi:S1-C subfamily serine protease